MAFLENTNYYSNWDDMSSNDQYLSSVDKFMYNTSDTVWNNASGCGYSNAAGGPSINVGGETFDMQPTLAWNQGDFFGQPQGFGASQTSCAPGPQGFQGDRQSCGGTGCYNSLGQRMYESGTGIPQGMSVQYTQV